MGIKTMRAERCWDKDYGSRTVWGLRLWEPNGMGIKTMGAEGYGDKDYGSRRVWG